MASYNDNTSQVKGWTFDLGSTVHVCSQKELFNSLVAKKEGTVKMVDGLAYEVIDTGTLKVTERDGTVRALEAIRYVTEARYNLICIRVLDKERRIQVQQDVVTVSQEDGVSLKGEKCGGLYKLEEGNSVRGGVSRISLEGSSSRGKISRKTTTGRKSGQSVARRRKGAFG